jgi:S1-C subfamily serine protease
MIEGWENNWDSKEDRGFFVEFTIPKNLKNLIINVRGVLIFKDGKKKKIVSVPEDSPYLDKQQDYLVAKLNIPIKSIKEIPGQIQKDDEIVSGTGFFINKGYLISNNHVIENCSSIDIIRKGYKSSAKVIDRDEINDLAILKAKQENSSYLKFRDKKKVKIGEKIITMGYPLGSLLGNNIKLTIGNISSLTGLMNDSTKLQLTAPIQHGNSGGPLLDKNGEVIGVVYAQLNNNIAQNVNLAIKANLVKMFLDTNGIQYQEYDTFENMNTEDVADMAKNGIVQVICR